MTLILLAAALLGPSVADYFPLVPGTKWTYEEKVAKIVSLQEDEVLEPVDVKGITAYPITTSIAGTVIQTLYYRVDDSAVWLIAHDPKTPLELPLPVFKAGDGRIKWVHTGPTEFAGDPALLNMKCESASKGTRDVLGTKREVIEVKTDATVGGGVTSIRNVQTTIYAKGVGLVEMRGEGKIGTRTTKFERRLIKFEPGGGAPR